MTVDQIARHEAAAWEQQPNETDRAFAAFTKYRDQPHGKRTIRNAAEAFYGDDFNETKVRQCEEWSRTHGWVERSREWDIERDRMRLETDLASIREMNEQHVTEARGLRRIGQEGLKRILHRMERDADYFISPGLVLQLLQQGQGMERLARGEPTEINKNLGSKQKVTVLWNEGAVLQVDDDDIDYDIAPASSDASDASRSAEDPEE